MLCDTLELNGTHSRGGQRAAEGAIINPSLPSTRRTDARTILLNVPVNPRRHALAQHDIAIADHGSTACDWLSNRICIGTFKLGNASGRSSHRITISARLPGPMLPMRCARPSVRAAPIVCI